MVSQFQLTTLGFRLMLVCFCSNWNFNCPRHGALKVLGFLSFITSFLAISLRQAIKSDFVMVWPVVKNKSMLGLILTRKITASPPIKVHIISEYFFTNEKDFPVCMARRRNKAHAKTALDFAVKNILGNSGYMWFYHCTEVRSLDVRFIGFPPSAFTIATIVNWSDRKLSNPTPVN